jgi:ribosomal protein S18 acetylase RimI-like enzyme
MAATGTSETNGSQWTLRVGGVEDAQTVVLLWRAAGAAETITDDPRSVERLIAHDPEALIVAEVGGEVVASLIVGFDGWRGHLYRLAVDPRLRRRGLGRALVAEAERSLRRRGARRVNALVLADHYGAVDFWEAVGYERDTRVERHVKTIPADDLS